MSTSKAIATRTAVDSGADSTTAGRGRDASLPISDERNRTSPVSTKSAMSGFIARAEEISPLDRWIIVRVAPQVGHGSPVMERKGHGKRIPAEGMNLAATSPRSATTPYIRSYSISPAERFLKYSRMMTRHVGGAYLPVRLNKIVHSTALHIIISACHFTSGIYMSFRFYCFYSGASPAQAPTSHIRGPTS